MRRRGSRRKEKFNEIRYVGMEGKEHIANCFEQCAILPIRGE